MAACEKCWAEAQRQAIPAQKSVMDVYVGLVHANWCGAAHRVPVERGNTARQQPQVATTDADREAAKRFVYYYNVRDIFQAREAPIEELTDMLARARAEEREACAKLCESKRDFYDSAAKEARGDSESVDAYEGRATALHRAAAAIRARSEWGKA